MTQRSTAGRYAELAAGQEAVESCLLDSVAEHLNGGWLCVAVFVRVLTVSWSVSQSVVSQPVSQSVMVFVRAQLASLLHQLVPHKHTHTNTHTHKHTTPHSRGGAGHSARREPRDRMAQDHLSLRAHPQQPGALQVSGQGWLL